MLRRLLQATVFVGVFTQQAEQNLGIDIKAARQVGVVQPKLCIIDDDTVVNYHQPIFGDRLIVVVDGLKPVGDEPRVSDECKRRSNCVCKSL